MTESRTAPAEGRAEFSSGSAAEAISYGADDAPNLSRTLRNLSVRGSTLRAFLTGARAAGSSVDEFVRSSGIAARFGGEHPDRIPIKQWARVVQHVQGALNDEAVGLLARPVPLGTFLMVCRAFIHCTTLGEAMERFAHFQNLLRLGLTFELEQSAKSVQLRVRPTEAGAIKHPIMADFAVLGFHRLFSWLAAELIQLDQLYVGSQPPEYANAYGDLFFNAPVHFNQEYYGLSFSRTYLGLPITRNEAELEAYTRRFTIGIFLPVERSGNLSLNLRAFLVEELKHSGRMPAAESAAAHFGLNPQSFCRRLRHEGVRFQDIKSRARRDVAMYHLSRTSISMEKVSEHAGFSEASAFIRAFKSWTKMTPLAYRKAMAKQ
jgi:AraC-like DNA-binding protein